MLQEVMSWLEGLTQYDWPQWHSDSEVQEIAKAALALLQKQEPVEPHLRCPTVYMNGTGKIEIICGNCGISIPLGKPNYCPWCGRAIKWTINKEKLGGLNDVGYN